jgi:hypothetical protein
MFPPNKANSGPYTELAVVDWAEPTYAFLLIFLKTSGEYYRLDHIELKLCQERTVPTKMKWKAGKEFDSHLSCFIRPAALRARQPAVLVDGGNSHQELTSGNGKRLLEPLAILLSAAVSDWRKSKRRPTAAVSDWPRRSPTTRRQEPLPGEMVDGWTNVTKNGFGQRDSFW